MYLCFFSSVLSDEPSYQNTRQRKYATAFLLYEVSTLNTYKHVSEKNPIK